MFANITDDELKTTEFDLDSVPRYRMLNDADCMSDLTRMQKVVRPLSEHFAADESCLGDPILPICVRLLTSDFKREVYIEEKLTDDESKGQKVVTRRRSLSDECKDDLKKKSCLVDPRLTKIRETTAAPNKELDLPLPRFATLPVSGDQNQKSRSSMMESMQRSISLLNVLSDNEFRKFSCKFTKFQQDIDTAISKHHIDLSDI